ncbi:MAG: S9 family peptidase [Caulobacteraceae bacterium]
MSRFIVGLAVAAGALVAWPAAAAAPIGDYGKLPAVEFMRLSPAGDLLAYIAVAGDQRRVVVRKADGGDLFAINVGSLKPRSIDWLGAGHLLIETSATLGNDPTAATEVRQETFQSTIVDTATGKAMNVFSGERLIFHATWGFEGYARDAGKEWAYFRGLTLSGSGEAFHDFSTGAGYITHGHTDLYRVDLATGHPERVAGGSEKIDTSWVVNAHGAVSAHTEYEPEKGDWRFYADAGDKALIADAANPVGDISLIGQGRAEGTVLVERPAGGDKGDFTLVEYNAATTAPEVALFGDARVRALLTDPDTGLLIGGVTNADDPRTILFDPALQTKFDKVSHAFPGERVRLVSATANLDRMVMFTEGAGDSGTYFLVDYPTRKITAVGWAYPTILQGDVAKTRVVPFKAADGLDMQGVLTLPPGRDAKALPLVVLPHGGPEDRDYATFDWWAQAFASRGYAVFQPNFRGSAGFGKAFRDAGYGEWGRKMQTDISDGVAELARQGLVDAKRACIVGASYGGYAALAGVTVQRGLYRCAVSVGGISDLNSMLKWEADRYGERVAALRYTHLYMGVKSNGDARLDAYSPRRLADKADAPILLIWGKDDTVVSIEQSRDFVDALRGQGKPVETLELPGEDHWLSREAGRVQMLTAAVAFVEKNNPAK